MPHRAELPEEPFAGIATPANDPSVPIGLAEPDPSLDFDDDIGTGRTPPRFGRLALWMASASALGVGVLGTVGYGMWFNHDQRVYTEAMSSARRTLGIDQPVMAAVQPSQTLSSGVVQAPALATATAVAAHADSTALADNPPSDTSDTTSLGPVAIAPAAVAPQDAAQRREPGTQAVASNRPSRAASAQAVRTAQSKEAARHRAGHNKAEPGLFARVGAFFQRVSYRRHAASGQREEYTRP